MRKLAATSMAVALCAVLTGSTVALAAAPPTRVSSEPEPGEELHEAPEQVSITFDQPLDPASFIAVENHCGNRVDDRDTEVTGNTMEVALTGRHSGTYHVSYFAKGLAGVTGQHTQSYTFEVHGGPSCGPGDDHQHDDDDDHDGKHDDHDGKHDDDDHEGDEHSGDGHDGDDSETHAAGHSSDDGSHADMGHEDGHEANGEHDDAAAEHDGEHEGHEENGIPNFASGPTGPPLRGPDTPAVLIALGLSMVMGVLGGTVLRISAPKS